MAKQRKPKVEILLEISFDGGRVKVCDLIDYLEEVRDTTKKNPDSHCSVLDIEVEGFMFTFYVIYRKLEGVKRVTEKDIQFAIKKLHEEE
ncbi:MAG: hypothetical protein WC919_00965 [Candidatus Paceibacterota bacterium]|jgi:hypothetical protein